MENIDVLYVLGKGSLWQDTEIRYSLRSIEKHLSGYRNIYIIGQLPEFLKDVRYIAFKDEHECKETNIYAKIIRACQIEELSDNFLFFNDDHFLVQDFVASEFPFFYKGTLRQSSKGMRPGSRYKQALDNAYRVLDERGLDTKNFDTHTPILYNKQEFINVMTKFDWNRKVSYVVKSLYANSLRIVGELEGDLKFNEQIDTDKILSIVADRKVFSTGNGVIGTKMMNTFNTLYPNKSKWEK